MPLYAEVMLFIICWGFFMPLTDVDVISTPSVRGFATFFKKDAKLGQSDENVFLLSGLEVRQTLSQMRLFPNGNLRERKS